MLMSCAQRHPARPAAGLPSNAGWMPLKALRGAVPFHPHWHINRLDRGEEINSTMHQEALNNALKHAKPALLTSAWGGG